jgi:hypothetical protein
VDASQISIGADPEMFLQDKTGKFISAIGKIGGTKEKPFVPKEFRHFPNGFAVQEDNVAVEFNVPPSLLGWNKLFSFCEMALDYLSTKADGLGLTLAIVPSANFSANQLRSKKAREFGCDADLNVWSLSENPRPILPKNQQGLRSAGGHIHIGYKEDPIGLARWLDVYLGLPSLFWDSDVNRRLLYGKAGTIRVKPYGIEYRTLSNFWLKGIQQKEIRDMVYNGITASLKRTMNREVVPEEVGREVISAINNSDVNKAKELCKLYDVY